MKKNLIYALLLILFSFRTSRAFEIKEIEVGSARQVLKWDVSRGPIRILLNEKGSADVAVLQVEEALKKALGIWQNVPNQAVRFEYAGRSPSAIANSSDQVNSVVWVESNWQFSPSVIAITRYSYFITDRVFFADADILMNGETYKWSAVAGQSQAVNIQQVLVHELGHLLGLSHTSVLNANLFPMLAAKKSLALSPDDKAGLQYLYGTPPVDFRLISPLQNALYPEAMSQKGLPLPIFRWNRATASNFTLEFSGSSSFQKKMNVAAGMSDSYLLKAGQETQLQKLSPTRRVYWRVVSAGSKTPARSFRFKPPLGSAGVAQIALETEDPMIRMLLLGTGILFVLLFISIALFFWGKRKQV